ncbi:heme biosynthesis operon protein HemX [Pseudomonas mangrovi]|uniref:Heme biosynthesis operon protein HemX n=1 Tax=Pseudomonas mangrovi TaxID=2161748 RepID=A0A2T5P5C5_9PSED|nr:heme biosynthesis operon protein HemX [Pseudomonas mangrovi]
MLSTAVVPAPRPCWRRCGTRPRPLFTDAKDGYVSEAELPKTLDADTPDVAPQPAVAAAPPPARRSNSLAWLALLLALLAGAAAGWTYWQLRQGTSAEVVADSSVAEALAELSSENRRLLERLETLESNVPDQRPLREAVTDLQAEQQKHGVRLERLQGDGRRELRLAEAEHLLRLASLRLSALQDVDSAVALIEGADEVLREQDDPTSFAARRELTRVLEALRTRPQPDRTGLYLKLATLRDEAFALTDSVPEFQRREAEMHEGVEQGHWERWREQLSSYVRIEFDAEQDIRPLLAGQSLAQVRLALGLALEQAQWAVLNGEEKVYQEAMGQAREVLESHFSENRPQVEALSQRLKTLAEEPISFATPDITPALEAFQAYLLRRQARPEPGQGDTAEAGQ